MYEVLIRIVIEQSKARALIGQLPIYYLALDDCAQNQTCHFQRRIYFVFTS